MDILDPTVRFENNSNQAKKVDQENKSIYESCIPFPEENRSICPWEICCQRSTIWRARDYL